jgi:hypothetical protein
VIGLPTRLAHQLNQPRLAPTVMQHNSNTQYMSKIIIILIFVFATFFCLGQSNDLPKREAYNLKIAVDSTNFYQTDVNSSPYILPENTIQLYPGEQIYVEVDLVKKEIRSMKTVKENLHPEKTMSISFSQETEGKKHKWMMLEIENPFKRRLEYKVNMFPMIRNKWVPTDVVPIQPGLSSYEMWPDIIITIALYGWEYN